MCLILSPSQSCCHSHCVNRSRARVTCEKQEINYAPCATNSKAKGPQTVAPCCQQEQLPRWTMHSWLGMLGSGTRATCASCKAGAWGLAGHSCSTTDPTGTQKLCGDKLPSNSSLDRRLRGLPLNCNKLFKKTTK